MGEVMVERIEWHDVPFSVWNTRKLEALFDRIRYSMKSESKSSEKSTELGSARKVFCG